MIDTLYGFGNGLIAAPWWTGRLARGLDADQDHLRGAPLMGAVAYLTLWERKAIGFTQIRPAPTASAPSAC
jgi:NADH-quinone oxidoreductase subunit H